MIAVGVGIGGAYQFTVCVVGKLCRVAKRVIDANGFVFVILVQVGAEYGFTCNRVCAKFLFDHTKLFAVVLQAYIATFGVGDTGNTV